MRNKASRIPVFNWDPSKLSQLPTDQLIALQADVCRQHANAQRSDGQLMEQGCETIYLYDKAGRRKLNSITWAIRYQQDEHRRLHLLKT